MVAQLKIKFNATVLNCKALEITDLYCHGTTVKAELAISYTCVTEEHINGRRQRIYAAVNCIRRWHSTDVYNSLYRCCRPAVTILHAV